MSNFLPAYAELHCRSNFSFLQGASHPEELVQRAVQMGYASLAITDECSLAGVVRAHVEAKKHDLPLIIGSEVTLSCGMRLVLLATNREGYGNLAECITLARRRVAKGSYLLHADDLDPRTCRDAKHLAGLPDCLALLIPARNVHQDEIVRQAAWLARVFPQRGWIALELLHGSDDDCWSELLHEVAADTGLPLAAAGDVLMHVRSRKPLQDTLTAIRLGIPIAQCGMALRPNAEQHLRSRVRLASLYPSELLWESVAIAERCTFSLDEVRYEYPEEIVPAGQSMTAYLRELTEAGLLVRFPGGTPSNVRTQIEKELGLIAELKYEAFFLTVYDIVKFARSKDILCQGRGSAANSAVCYCLGITEVDPSRSNALFERFVSKERGEPPDIDVDFEHQRREEVMQYIYGKYGRHRAALTAALIRYKPRSAMKDVGKALGLDFDQVNRLSHSHKWWDGNGIDEDNLRACGFDPEAAIVQKLMALTDMLIGFPRHLSQHSGGFVIARDNLARLVPIENATMENRSVIEWDKDDLDELKLLKVDVLALGMLSAIKRALDMIGLRRGIPFPMQDVPKEDPLTYDMICAADTIGVFQVESRAQMSMSPRLRPRTYYDLVVQVAIVRPGPIQGGMVHPYLTQRHMPKDQIVYPGPEVKEVLSRTFGVPIFQEQVMEIAIKAADFTAGEADELRRSMAAWRRKGSLDKYGVKLKEGLKKNGYSTKFADQLFEQIKGFGEYGFPESHAASFALLVYVSAWIKRHEPAAFLAAMLNSQPMGFYSPSQLVQDAKRHGVEVRPIDVITSGMEATMEDMHSNAPAVRLGLQMVKGLSPQAAQRIEAARGIKMFDSVDDLGRRAMLNQQELGALAGANALVTLAGHRRQAKWEVAAMVPSPILLREAPIAEQKLLLGAASEGADIVDDYTSTGLTLQRHPLALLRPKLRQMKLSTAQEMQHFADRQIARTTGIVTMRQRPPTAKGTMFVSIEDETGSTNVIVWPALLEKQRNEVLNAQLLTVYGIWQSKDGVSHLVAKRVVDHSEMLGELLVASRDFR